MAIATSDYNWIALRLPDVSAGTTFSKNGVNLTIRQALDQSWADHADRSAEPAARRALSLADVLDMIAADDRFSDLTQGPWRGVGPRCAEMARYWRQQASNAAAVPSGTLSGVATSFNGQANPYGGTCRDEFAA